MIHLLGFVKIVCMTSNKSTTTRKKDQAELEFSRVIESVCSRGFYGTASVTVQIQDGHIQYTRVLVDRMVK